MLREIKSPVLNHSKITFHPGMNIILGDDNAKNSIGKSTALMIIDFVQGGNSFLKDEAGAIKALGHHYYNFSFDFSGQLYFFSRATDTSDVVYICDDNYVRLGVLTLYDFRNTLQKLYGLANHECAYRSLITPFARIWRKGGLEPDQPFTAAPKEPFGVAINRLIDLFGYSSEITEEKKVIDEQKSRKKLIRDSMNAEIIPKINKSQYEINNKTISANGLQIEQLKQGFSGALNAYEALFDEKLQIIRQQKNALIKSKGEVQTKIKKLEREISGITPRLTANISLVAEYFPSVNIEKLEKVEEFHHKISRIVKKELQNDLAAAQLDESDISGKIISLEQQIQQSLKSKGLPDDLFNHIFNLKEITDKAIRENEYFIKKLQLDESLKLSSSRLDNIYSRIFLDIERKINLKLKAFNKIIYGPTRNSSELRIKSANSFIFTSPQDTGTGKSYAGLVGFDLAMLASTKLPFFMHDSVVYKNIEITATQKIFRILAAIKSKQIFLSFDEAKKFGEKTEKTINSFICLKLSHDNLLYNTDWRDSK